MVKADRKNEIEVVGQREVEGAYGFYCTQAIIDHPRHGRLLITEGWGGNNIKGEQYRWEHGAALSVLADDTFASLDEMINPETRVIDAALLGYDDERRLLDWDGYAVANLAKRIDSDTIGLWEASR